MKKLVSLAVAAVLMAPAAVSFAGSVDIHIGVPVPPPPPPVIVPEPPRPSTREVVVLPPPPPTVVIAPGPPSDWFWDDGRDSWFYYDVDRRPHYVRRHVYVDDGRHHYSDHGKWRTARGDMGKHKGWYKHHEKEGKHEWREERHEHGGHGRGHGRGHGHDD